MRGIIYIISYLFCCLYIFSCASSDTLFYNRLKESMDLEDSDWNRYSYSMQDDISYADYGGALNHQLAFDLYRPKGINPEKSLPLIIFLHSGGFVTGDKRNHIITQYCRDFAARGYLTASVGYRTIHFPKVGDINTWNDFKKTLDAPRYIREKIYDSIRDIRTAIRYFKANAETYNIDPDNIFLAGFSSGAVISLHIAFYDDKEAENYFGKDLGCLDCLPFINGEADSYNAEVKGIIAISGGVFDTYHIDPEENPPILMIHGDKDKIAPFKSGKPFQKFVKDYQFGIPGLVYELGVTKTKHLPDEDKQNYERIIGGLKVEFEIPEWLSKMLIEKLAPDFYGSKRIVEKTTKKIEFIEIKGGGHNFILNEEEDFNECYGETRAMMLDFFRRNISKKNRRGNRDNRR